jgi:hypothetical protein
MNKRNVDIEGNEYCFGFLPDMNGAFKIVKHFKGIRGYADLSHEHVKEMESVSKKVDELNEQIGVDKKEALQITLSAL